MRGFKSNLLHQLVADAADGVDVFWLFWVVAQLASDAADDDVYALVRRVLTDARAVVDKLLARDGAAFFL